MIGSDHRSTKPQGGASRAHVGGEGVGGAQWHQEASMRWQAHASRALRAHAWPASMIAITPSLRRPTSCRFSSAHRRGPCTRSVTATFAHQFSSRLEHETACPATTDARRRWGTAGNQEQRAVDSAACTAMLTCRYSFTHLSVFKEHILAEVQILHLAACSWQL